MNCFRCDKPKGSCGVPNCNIVRDGESVVVPLLLMDGVQQALASHTASLDDARARSEAAYDAFVQRLNPRARPAGGLMTDAELSEAKRRADDAAARCVADLNAWRRSA